MKYKRQLMTSVLAIGLLVGGTTVFADSTTTPSKEVKVMHQIKMKSHENDNSTSTKKVEKKIKKEIKKNHKKEMREMKEKTSTTSTSTLPN